MKRRWVTIDCHNNEHAQFPLDFIAFGFKHEAHVKNGVRGYLLAPNGDRIYGTPLVQPIAHCWTTYFVVDHSGPYVLVAYMAEDESEYDSVDVTVHSEFANLCFDYPAPHSTVPPSFTVYGQSRFAGTPSADVDNAFLGAAAQDGPNWVVCFSAVKPGHHTLHVQVPDPTSARVDVGSIPITVVEQPP